MSPRWILLALPVAAVLAAVNWQAYRSVVQPAPRAAAGELAWDAFAGIAGRPGSWSFPPALAAQGDRPLTITGVLVPHAGMRGPDGRMLGALFAPPSRLACCGLACDVRPQFTSLLEFAAPQADPGRQRLARITGRLRLDPAADGWAATAIAADAIELLPDP